MDGDLVSFLLILIFVLFSAFFSSSEAAFLSIQRTRISHLVNSGVPGARRVAAMIGNPERLLSTILLGNNLVNVAFTAFITAISVEAFGEGRGILVATVGGTIVLLLFGEIIPKSIAVKRAEGTALLYARPLKIVELVLWPVVIVLQWISNVISNMVGGHVISRASITEGEFRTLIDIGEAEGTFEAVEAEMLENVFRFGDRQVREVMTPRPEIVSLKRGSTLKEFLDAYVENSHTRFPVFEDDIDNILGVVSSKDILKAIATRGLGPDDSVTDDMRDVHFVPETKRVAELFEELKTSGNQMAIIVDEYGGLAGLVTLKRLSEEVVGPVGEEGEGLEEEYHAIDENTYEMEGGISIDEANSELGLRLPSGDYDTVAGFALNVLGHIPEVGEQFEFDRMLFQIEEMKDLKIEKLTVTRLQTIQEAETVEAHTDSSRGNQSQ